MAEYVDFVLQPQEGIRKTEKYKVLSVRGSHELGIVAFHPQWRKYAFWPETNTLFDQACLRDIADFVEKRTVFWRLKVKARTHREASHA